MVVGTVDFFYRAFIVIAILVLMYVQNLYKNT